MTTPPPGYGQNVPPEDPLMGTDPLMVLARNQTWAMHLTASIVASLIGISVWSPFNLTLFQSGGAGAWSGRDGRA